MSSEGSGIRFKRAIAPILGFLLFLGALLILRHELHQYDYHQILAELRRIATGRLLMAMLLTLAGYVALTGYDTLASRYVHHPIAYRKTGMASFIGYAFSNTLGFALLTGAPIRFRLYSVWGLSAVEITNMVAFCSLTFWLGYLTLAGAAFAIEPFAAPASLHLPFATVRPLGIAFLLIVAAYVLATVWLKKPLHIRGWAFHLPSIRIVPAQLAMGVLDWALAAAVLYQLLPGEMRLTYFGFLGIFLLAQVAGILSQVPGGLGVFETVALLLLTPYVKEPTALVGSLLAFRAVYYLLPLALAAVALGAHEVLERREGLVRILRFFGKWAPQLVPNLLAFTTLVAGAILLFSGATPAVGSRLSMIHNLLPLPVLEISHFLGSIAGVGLLILARGLQRRLDGAYHLSTLLLGAGIVLSLLKGFDYEEAIYLAVMLLVLISCRRHFHRRASLISERFTAGWIATILVILALSVWLGVFAYKRTAFSNELWWKFAFIHGDAPRFLRATTGAIGAVLLFALARLLRPAQPEPGQPDSAILDRVAEIVGNVPGTTPKIALLGDKEILFSASRNSFVMYGVKGRSWVSLGDPVGLDSEKSELAWYFRELCDRHAGWPVFYQVPAVSLPLYLDLGLTLLKVGEEARVPLPDFSLDGRPRKWLRHVHRKFEEKDGCSFEIRPPEEVAALLPSLQEVSDQWLATKNTREKGFSIGYFNEDYLRRLPIALVMKEGRILAFANVWLGGRKDEISLDLMRYAPEASNGVMEYLFVSLMLWGRQEGYQWFNLGMAPLSGLENRSLAPIWHRLGAIVFRYGEHFYNFQGLRNYKEKFEPVWEPKYLASPGGIALPRILTDIASLISGGIRGVVAK